MQVGERVVINSNMWIIMDISPPKLGGLTINGKLSFMSNASYPRDLLLQTPSISVFGSLEILGNITEDGDDVFKGTATINLFGAKGSSLPITMAQGRFLGAKVIGVSGELRAKGKAVASSWTRLRSHTAAGSVSVDLTTFVDWNVGDEVVIAATGYFSSTGTPFMADSKSTEIRTISAIEQISDGANFFSRISLNSKLNYTHFCGSSHDEEFCGAVGVLTKTVRFTSSDSENPKSSSFGFGGHIQVFDIPSSSRYGSIEVENIEFKNFGKINSDKYAIAIAYENYNHPASSVKNCSFNQGYNIATRVNGALNFTFSNNVATGNYGGGIFIEIDCMNFLVRNNFVAGAYMLPSNLLSSYPWTNPIAGVVVYSPDGEVYDNLVAGSQDQGFAIAAGLFKVSSDLAASMCRVTTGAAMSYSSPSVNKFRGNEAVGCRGGLMVLTMSASESLPSDCAVINGFKAWRNGHTGILSVDAEASILIMDAVLAENHIGVNLHFFKEGL
jgi:hypothetical protein